MTQPTERVSTRLSQEEFEEFADLAFELDRSLAWCARQALVEWTKAQNSSLSGQ